MIGVLVFVFTLLLPLAAFLILRPGLPEHQKNILGVSLKGLEQTSNNLEKMNSQVSADAQKMFLTQLQTNTELSVSEGVKMENMPKFLEETFKTGTWTEEEKAHLRRLEVESTVKSASHLNCDLENGQKCELSKFHVLGRQYYDEKDVERMNIYYSHSTVKFTLQDLQKAEEANGQGWFWNAASWIAGSQAEATEKQKPNKVTIQALGNFFLDYTSNENEKAFYEKVINVIDPERSLQPKTIATQKSE